MMTCGVLPIDKMRDYIGPMGLILGKIPKEVLEAHYKIILPPRENKKLYTVSTFCSTFAAKKGWFTGRSLPNEFQAAKTIMKDFTTGKLAFVHLRPDFDASKHDKV
jgi:large subunit GTPase 1